MKNNLGLPLLTITALLFTISISPLASGQASEKKSDFAESLADDLAECGGVFQTMADVMKSLDKNNATKTYNNIARGAWMASAYLLHMLNNLPDWDKALAKAETDKQNSENYWKGLFELHTPSEQEPFPDGFIRALNYCTELNPVQDEIVQMMRKEIYSQEE